MSIRTILTHPDQRLRKIANPVTHFDAELEKLANDMLDTMYAKEGIGLAATQIDIHTQVFVMDVSDSRDQPHVLINPHIEVLDVNETAKYQEGCLSIPGFYEEIVRPTQIRVTYNDLKGKQQILEPEGLLAVCVQHECDHLHGRLFIDYVSIFKRNRITNKILQQQKKTS